MTNYEFGTVVLIHFSLSQERRFESSGRESSSLISEMPIS